MVPVTYQTFWPQTDLDAEQNLELKFRTCSTDADQKHHRVLARKLMTVLREISKSSNHKYFMY